MNRCAYVGADYGGRVPKAIIIGGTGLIGRAVARRLLAAGWTVDAIGRNGARLPPAGARFVAADRNDPAELRAALGGGADLLVDCVCYTGPQARALLPLLADVGSTVSISSKAVYVDAAGNHSNSPVPPDFGGPVPETQPTLAPREDLHYDSRDGYGPCKVAAERVLLEHGHPVTVLRPSKVHGDGAEKPNEWVFVRRVLDRRPVVLLAAGGLGGDHPSAAANIAALVETAAGRPGRRILNAADPDAPNGLEIARIVARHLGHEWREVPLPADAPAGLGRHPWHRLPPVRLDMTAAADLEYEPVGDYATTVAAELDWLVAAARSDALPAGFDHAYFDRMLDYAAEDEYLAGS